MKKLLLTSFVLIVATVSVSAQTEFGVRSGFYKNMRETNLFFGNDGLADGGNYNEGFYVGAFVGFKLSEKFSIQPEITYASVRNDFDQIHIPVLGRYRIGKKFSMFLGPDVGFLLIDNKSFKKINFGITFGASYEIIDKLSIEARCYYALTESLKSGLQAIYAPTDVSTKFNNYQIGLSYRFD